MRRVTCLVSDNEYLFLTDSGLILQNLTLQDPILNHVVSVCSAFYKEHGFGLKSLLYLTTEIYKLSSSLHQQGIPVRHIQQHLEESLEICKKAAKDIEIPIHKSTAKTRTQEYFKLKESSSDNNSRNNNVEPNEKQCRISDVMETVKGTIADGNKIPVIELKMSVRKNDEEEEDLDDVDWFFTEEESLGTREMDPPFKTTNTSSGAQRYFDIEVNEVIQTSALITSLKSGGSDDTDDDDFEDCFEDVPRVSKSRTFHSKSCGKELFNQCPNLEHSHISDSFAFDRITTCDNEFNECFEGQEFNVHQERNFQIDKQNICIPPEKDVELLDKLLRKMSSIKSCHNKVKNSSRHFKTIESTVKELRGDGEPSNENHEKGPGKSVSSAAWKTSRGSSMDEGHSTMDEGHSTMDEGHSTMHEGHSTMDEGLSTMDEGHSTMDKGHSIALAERAQMSALLISKVKTSSSKVLNRSRHYKTFDTTLEELNESKTTEKSVSVLTNTNMLRGDTGESERDDRRIGMGKDLQSTSELSSVGDVEYQSIARGLSHGCEEVMDIVLLAARKQSKDKDALELNESRLHIITSCGRVLGDNPGLVDGTVVQVSDDIITAAFHKGEQLLRTVVINGELTPSFRHKGFRPTLDKVSTTLSLQEYQTSGKKSWVQEATQILEQHQIDVVLASGKISSDLQGQLPHIIFIHNVPYSALQSICSASDVTMAIYITDISQFHVCPEVILKPLLEDWNCSDRNYINITHPKSLTQTVVYSHPALIGRSCFEQEFWRCVRSLSRALGKGTVLPGGGETERHCAMTLLSMADTVEYETSSEVMKELAQILHNYIQYVNSWSSISELFGRLSLVLGQRETSPVHPKSNSASPSPPGAFVHQQDSPFYDEATTKYNSWFAAMNMALTLLQIDASIVTGINKSLTEI
uniref:Bardet-Biedl syndrome 12 protein homolog isoform X2 n=1 Tax=Crassostrea virginica TaxID=6565 RepID=A0A8B8DTK6_CRAVI|nr:Bardet-Biedl syndrome 12 protein homolog isoform X2 [Crassostrea virginica]